MDGLLDEGVGGGGSPLVDGSDGGVGLSDGAGGGGASGAPLGGLPLVTEVLGVEEVAEPGVLGVSVSEDVSGFSLFEKSDGGSSLEVSGLTLEEDASVSKLVGDDDAFTLDSSVDSSDRL